jgi:hypothetical protein
VSDPTVGCWVFSASEKWADDDVYSKGGIVVDTYPDPETGEITVRVVEFHRGQACYHRFPGSDIGESDLPNLRSVRGMIRQLGRIDAVKHAQAIAALAQVEGGL